MTIYWCYFTVFSHFNAKRNSPRPGVISIDMAGKIYSVFLQTIETRLKIMSVFNSSCLFVVSCFTNTIINNYHCTSVPIGQASVRRPPVSSTSARRDLLLSAIARLLLPARDSGTVYLSTSSLPHHSQHFVIN